MRRFSVILFLVSAALASAPNYTHAQTLDSTMVGRFQLAESFMRAAQFERAIAILEDLYDSSPETHVFYERLREAYESVKRYDAAINLVNGRIESEPNPASYFAERARLQYLKGDEASARESWQAAIGSSPGSPGVYLLVYRSLMQVRLFEFAIEILEQGRAVMENQSLFQTDLAQLYSLTQRHDQAMEEYLRLLETNGEQLNFVRGRLDQFITESDALQASITVTENAVARIPLNRSFRELLAWLYIEGDQFRDALDVYRAVDRLEREEGRMLFNFAQIAADGEAYDVALEAYEEILQRYPDAPSAPDAVRGLGIMQEKWAETLGEEVFDQEGTRIEQTHFDDALDTYQRFLLEYPQDPNFPDVLRRVGRLYQDVFFDNQSAARILTEVIARYPQTVAADQAAYDMGRLAVSENNLQEARTRFSRLLTRLRTGDLADLARYQMSLLHFYQGEFDAAMGMTVAMQENTSTDVANDAIDLKVKLIENRGPDSLDTALRMFARAELQSRQRNPEEAIHLLEDMMRDHGGHPLVDDARFLRAGLLESLGRFEEAVQTYLEIPLMHQDSFLGDRSVFEAARITNERIGNTEEAIRLYERVLTEFPGSLLLGQTRDEIRRLRGDEV